MYIGPLPLALRNIEDDGRSAQDIIAALESKNVAVFPKDLFIGNAEPIPSTRIVYNFLATVSGGLPRKLRSSVEDVFEAANRQHGNLRKPSLRSALLLMERMTRERLFADIVVINEPILNSDSGNPILLSLGREDEEGQSWIAAVSANYTFDDDSEVVLFLGPAS
jgi:hypothetical protein